MIHHGTPVIVVNPGVYMGRRGVVVHTHPNLMFSVRMWARAEEPTERSALSLFHRSQIRRAGMTMNSTIVPPDADAMETVNASLEFVAEARGEIARVNSWESAWSQWGIKS